jgi:hypothetical protein
MTMTCNCADTLQQHNGHVFPCDLYCTTLAGIIAPVAPFRAGYSEDRVGSRTTWTTWALVLTLGRAICSRLWTRMCCHCCSHCAANVALCGGALLAIRIE